MVYTPLEKSVAEADSKTREHSKKDKEKKEFFDDFDSKSDYWGYRTNGVADITYENSVVKLHMGPTEALYYSNAEIADGDFTHLPWEPCNMEAKIRLSGNHYGSAGWGFWNYSMTVDGSIPIWFIYLRSNSSKYPLNGFYVQVGNVFTPIKYFIKPPRSLRIAIKLLKGLIPVKFTSTSPVMQNIDISEWHIYKMLRDNNNLVFYIDDNKISKISIPDSKYGFRADAWIDNAVFSPLKGDYARVYRHVTHENREKATLEIDYIKIWL